MFINKISALLALAFCATSASANYMRAVDVTVYDSQATAQGNALTVKPNTVYIISKPDDKTSETDYLYVKCPKAKTRAAAKKGFMFYVSYYDGYDGSEANIYSATNNQYLNFLYAQKDYGDGYMSLGQFFCHNGQITTNTYS